LKALANDTHRAFLRAPRGGGPSSAGMVTAKVTKTVPGEDVAPEELITWGASPEPRYHQRLLSPVPVNDCLEGRSRWESMASRSYRGS
jgi:hypothetical protein